MKTCKNCNTKNNDLNSFCTNCKNPFVKINIIKESQKESSGFIIFLKIMLSLILLFLFFIGFLKCFRFYILMVGYILNINTFLAPTIPMIVACITAPLIPIWLVIFLFINVYSTILHAIIGLLTLLSIYFIYLLYKPFIIKFIKSKDTNV